MDQNISLEDFAAQVNGSISSPESEPANEPIQETTPEPDPEPQTDPAPAAQETNDGTEPQPNTEPDPEPDDAKQRSNQAFIHMRQELSSKNNLLKNIAGVLGLDSKDEKQLMTALQEQVTNAQAKQNNVPPELMQRLNFLEQQEQARVAAQRQQNVAFGFNQLATKFKLDQAGLNKFANDLVAAGINPLEKDVDLIREYKIMHYDDEVAKARDAAVAAEQARAAKAAQQSSTPGNTTSGPNNSTDKGKVNSVHDLENWMRTQI